MQKLIQQWTLRRLLYLAMGILVGIQAIQDHIWFLLIPALWFGSMGIFALGCAGPTCAVDTDQIESEAKREATHHE